MLKAQLKIDIISDVCSPWCVIGYKRLEQALEQIKNKVQAKIHWHAYEVNPNMPYGGQNLYQYELERQPTSIEIINANREEKIFVGNQLGFEFNYYEEMRIYNTHDAHKLVLWAGDFHNKQTELQMKFFEAYFTKQLAIDDPEILLNIVEEIEMDRESAKNILLDHRNEKLLINDEKRWEITRPPVFIVNEKHRIEGAQMKEVFARVLSKIADSNS